MTEKDLQRIIREAEKLLKPQNNPSKKVDFKVSKEARVLKKKMDKYRELKGSRRLSKSEKMALLNYTPKQVFNAQKLTEKQKVRREKLFENIVGRAATAEDLTDLQYMSPAALAKKKYGIIPKKKPKKQLTYEESYPNTFTPVQLPAVRWWDIPASIRGSRKERIKGGFLYENSGLLWETSESISLAKVARLGVDGRGISKLGFLRSVLAKVSGGEIFVDPMGEGKMFFVYASEWDKVDELPEDYAETRRYKAKK